MKTFPKKFYLPASILISLILIFFTVTHLKSTTNYDVKKPIVAQNTNIAAVINNNSSTNTTVTNPVPPPKKPLVLSEEDKKFLATLEKEDLPKDIASLKFAHLDVPFFKQQYLRSCEEASLRAVLAYYGIKTNDLEIVKRVGYAPHPWDTKNNIWDDPNTMFVGFISDRSKSGYGTYAPALAAGARTFGRDAQSYLGVTSQFLAQQIYSGYPVIVWGFYATPPFVQYTWKTKDGKVVNAYKGEHARVIVGVFGDPSKPVGFLLDDPLTGEKEEYWSAERLMTHMNTLGNLTNQAVVVK